MLSSCAPCWYKRTAADQMPLAHNSPPQVTAWFTVFIIVYAIEVDGVGGGPVFGPDKEASETGKTNSTLFHRRFIKMNESNFMRVEDVAKELDVSKSYAYKIVQRLNAELKDKGYLTVSGRVNRKFFMEKFCYSGTEGRDI